MCEILDGGTGGKRDVRLHVVSVPVVLRRCHGNKRQQRIARLMQQLYTGLRHCFRFGVGAGFGAFFCDWH